MKNVWPRLHSLFLLSSLISCHTALDHLTDSAAHGALMLFFPTDDTDWLRFASYGSWLSHLFFCLAQGLMLLVKAFFQIAANHRGKQRVSLSVYYVKIILLVNTINFHDGQADICNISQSWTITEFLYSPASQRFWISWRRWALSIPIWRIRFKTLRDAFFIVIYSVFAITCFSYLDFRLQN